MQKSDKFLGEFEQMVMLAILRLNDNAYGASIRQLLSEQIKRDVSIGALYTTVERLENKGMLTSRLGESNAARGGRAKKFFVVTAKGASELTRSKNALLSLWQGLSIMSPVRCK